MEEGTSSSAVQLEGAPPEAVAQAALDLKVARAMFFGGFAGLPLLWLVSWLHFRKAARAPHADPRLGMYVRRSLAGAAAGGALVLAWALLVAFSWRSWGAFGRGLMLVLPLDDEEL
ncbi:hypothetical protein AB1Y20_007055 [Prymnesium parvum]|uniref:Gamma-secretase subunit PEN-2 n=1 Tax=Prymnesium parvum TaxID=97485 RepID=A0AB34J079_PRYPA|mmetsp:Transcript_31497/g.78493  ORF Transcript_31497/g.78493 Transcript_31497/m.78493 type:complete len:116 (+) Transcript_31497:15-362(+)